MPRLGISVIGQGVSAYDEPLFRKLRPQGAYFTSVNPENGLKMLLDAVAARAKAHPAPYGHWYIDGGQEAAHDPAADLRLIQGSGVSARGAFTQNAAEVEKPGMGPEALRTTLASNAPADLGMGRRQETSDSDRFQVRVLTEGAGTQVFSTTFAQWTAREALRRAQPLTMIVRFAPRQRQKPMNEMLYGTEDARTGLRRLVGRCRHGSLLQLSESAAAAGCRAIFISGLVRRAQQSGGDRPCGAAWHGIVQSNRSKAIAHLGELRSRWGGHSCPPPLKLGLILKSQSQSQRRRTRVSAPHRPLLR